jgi:D-serine deaminase-like pyridoxal phosphate-dependent protein
MLTVDELVTPAAVVDRPTLEANIGRLAGAAADRGRAVRPHVKTHKCLAIARLQADRGAAGFTTATLDEAELLVDGGLHDVLVCHPLRDDAKRDRLLGLVAKAPRAATIVEDGDGARALAGAAAAAGRELDVRIKVDTGLGRIGVQPGEPFARLVELVRSLAPLRLTGAVTHEGYAYRIADRAERARVVGDRLAAFAAECRELGLDTVSTGATPALYDTLDVAGITEVRPGNYAVFDAMQVGLGAARVQDCAMTVVTTVVSVRPGGRRAIVDAGSKALSTDTGVHGHRTTSGHGIVLGRPGVTVAGLSEEHGWLELDDDAEPLRPGDRLAIVPVHACAAIACFAQLQIAEDDVILASEPVAARGHARVASPERRT